MESSVRSVKVGSASNNKVKEKFMIHITNEFFLSVFREKLKQVKKMLGEADEKLYENEEEFESWNNVRQSALIIDEMIEGTQKYKG